VATVVASPDAASVGRAIPLDGTPTTVGRTDQAGLVLADPRLSGLHAVFRPGRGGRVPSIADLGSRNGTFVDGAPVQSAELLPGAVVRLGDTCLVLDDLSESDDPLLLGGSSAIAALRLRLAEVAPTPLTVLLLGETGTGKELAARRLHQLSGRGGRLVPVNCAAIPEHLAESTLFGHRRGAFTGATDSAPGLFVQADGGTLHLDEIGDLPLPVQAKLLRVIEDLEVTPVGGRRGRRVDVRIVAATNVDLRAAVGTGGFRPDLFARLEEWPVRLPPLRDRRADVVLLARTWLGERDLSADAAEALLLHDWPFNVRELAQLCRRLTVAVEAHETIVVDDLPSELSDQLRSRRRPPAPGDDREQLEAALGRCLGNVARTSRMLGISRRTLYRRLSELGLDPEDYRG